MTIYKVHANRVISSYYTDRAEAEAAYEKLASNLAAPQEPHYVKTTYRVDGVFLERGDNCNSIDECENIRDAYLTAENWETEKLAIGKDEE